MEDAVFACPAEWEPWVSPQTRRLRKAEELSGEKWGNLLLPSKVIRKVTYMPSISCECLLVGGDCPAGFWAHVQAKHVITYGLSQRDSLTLSSLEKPVLCVQRALPRLDGTIVEPQELPLKNLPLPAEQMLPLLGLWLLQMPLIENFSL